MSASRLGAVIALVVTLGSAPARALAPLEAYGRLPAVERVALSPDGSKVAILETVRGERLLAVVPLKDPHGAHGYRLGDGKVRSVSWADDDRILITTASTEMPMEMWGAKTEWHLVHLIDLKRNDIHSLLDRRLGDVQTMNTVYGEPEVRRVGADTVVFLHGHYVAESQLEPALFSVNLSDRRERIVRKGDRSTIGWLLGDDGAVLAEEGYVEAERRWKVTLFRGGHPRESLSGIAPLDAPEVLGLTRDGSALVLSTHDDSGWSWKTVRLADGGYGDGVLPEEAATAFLHEYASARMSGAALVEDATSYHFLDAPAQERWNWVTRMYAGERVRLESMSADRTRFVVEVFGPKSGYAYFLADASTHVTELIRAVYPDVTEIAEVRRIEYAAGDGRRIPAYLTLPPGREAKALPLVVMPHGGPEARDVLDFDWWAQALASRGYLVLQPNFRGSALGAAWVEAGYGQWGRKMQTDLSDGVAYLAGRGLADPKRACIVGASYGGYAALAGVALQAGIYRCAVSFAGVADLATLIRDAARSEGGYATRYWDRFLAVSGPADRQLDELSPQRHVADIAVPLLLIHGREDTVVPYAQSAEFAKALKRAGKTFEFVSLDKEDHHLSLGETRLRTLQATVDFLGRVNPAD